MLDNQFQFVLMATEDRVQAQRTRSHPGEHPAKRVFRLISDRQPARETGRR